MSIVIKVNPFKASSIKQAIKDLKAYKARILRFPKLFIDAIGERLNEILEKEAPAEAQGLWKWSSEELEGGGARATFEFNGEVEFIEFGTGIVGAENHEGANMDWAERLPGPYTGYESGPTINKESHTWVYRDENGELRITMGQAADPFIYRSFQQIIQEAPEIAKKVLRGEYQQPVPEGDVIK